MSNVSHTDAQAMEPPKILSGRGGMPGHQTTCFRRYAAAAWTCLVLGLLLPVMMIALLVLAWPLAPIFAYGLWFIGLLTFLVTGSLMFAAHTCFLLSWLTAPEGRSRKAMRTTFMAVLTCESLLAVYVAAVYFSSAI